MRMTRVVGRSLKGVCLKNQEDMFVLGNHHFCLFFKPIGFPQKTEGRRNNKTATPAHSRNSMSKKAKSSFQRPTRCLPPSTRCFSSMLQSWDLLRARALRRRAVKRAMVGVKAGFRKAYSCCLWVENTMFFIINICQHPQQVPGVEASKVGTGFQNPPVGE